MGNNNINLLLFFIICSIFQPGLQAKELCYDNENEDVIVSAMDYLSIAGNKPADLSSDAKVLNRDLIDCLVRYNENLDARSNYILGRAHEIGYQVKRNAQVALGLIRTSAKQGFPNAQVILANSYYTGDGVEKSLESFMYWTELAAKGGNTRAQFNMGVIYSTGRLVPINQKKAAKWYLNAAEKDDAEAQYALAMKYFLGKGVEKDYKKSLFWMSSSAASGNVQAKNAKEVMFEEISLSKQPSSVYGNSVLRINNSLSVDPGI